MSLRKKMASGALWSLFEKVGEQGLAFVVFAILARLLGPEEFGLANLCYVYMLLADLILFGLADGIVNLHLRDDRRLSTLFWSVMAVGVVLAGLGFVLAAPFAAMMGDPRIEPLFKWIAITPLFIAGSAVPMVLVMASMNFRIFSIRTLVSVFIGGVVGVVMAYRGFGAYALIGQQITIYVSTNIILWLSCGWSPKLIFDRSAVREVLMPGFKMTGSSIVQFLDQQAPRLLIGLFLGPILVGYFAFVARIRQALYAIFMYPLAIVIYPAFAQIKENSAEQKTLLRQILVITGTLVFPSVAGIIATADIFIPLLFGAAWIPAIPVAQLLLVVSATFPFVVVLRDVLRAHNKTQDYLRTQIIFVVILLVSTFVLAPHGLIALSWGIVLLSFASIPAFIFTVAKSTKISLWRTFTCLWPPLISALVMILAVRGYLESSWRPDSLLLQLVSAVALGASVYIGGCFILQRAEMKNMLKFVARLRVKKVPMEKPVEPL